MTETSLLKHTNNELNRVNVCITAFVFGTYKRFIPFFCYSAVKSYPEYTVKIFVDGELGPVESSSLEDIRKNVSGNIVIQENSFKGMKLPATPPLMGGQKMLLRWLFERSDFDGFDCVYFSDIDFLVLRQEPTLAEFHLGNARRLRLPFSNMVREDKTKARKGSNRLTGLHFVLSDPYFAKTEKLVKQYKKDPALIASAIPEAYSNEHFLFHLVQSSIPFDRDQLVDAPRPLPGAHLAWSQNPKRLGVRTERMVNAGSTGEPSFPRIHEQLAAFLGDPVFRRMLRRMRVPEVIVLLDYMGVRPSRLRHRLNFRLLAATVTIARLSRLIAAKLRFQHRHQGPSITPGRV